MKTNGAASRRQQKMGNTESKKHPYNLRSSVRHASNQSENNPSGSVPRSQRTDNSRRQDGTAGASRRQATQTSQESKSYLMGPTPTVETLLADHTVSVPSPLDEMCSVCMVNLQEESDFCNTEEEYQQPTQSQDSSKSGVIELKLCHHQFHLVCIKQMMEACKASHLQCPCCKKIHGLRTGNQPPGERHVFKLSQSLPGYPDCGTVGITYNFQHGTQGPEHPNPGHRYQAYAFPRTAFLPDNPKGNRVLELLGEAWRRRLVFTVGTSVTTGMSNVITWNEIHHKTEFLTNYSGHGYPDELYLDRVLMELEMVGVTEVTTD